MITGIHTKVKRLHYCDQLHVVGNSNGLTGFHHVSFVTAYNRPLVFLLFYLLSYMLISQILWHFKNKKPIL